MEEKGCEASAKLNTQDAAGRKKGHHVPWKIQATEEPGTRNGWGRRKEARALLGLEHTAYEEEHKTVSKEDKIQGVEGLTGQVREVRTLPGRLRAIWKTVA